jgi:GH15 family glucan-1,4-alpha-glucosidase
VRFLVDVVDAIVGRWREPDAGIWEMRGPARHFVHSKVMCWAAVHRGLEVVEHAGLEAPRARWRGARDELRAAIEREGYDRERGVFVQAFGSRELDAALLLLPRVGFVAHDDPRMLRTVEAICRDLREGEGLVRRYRGDDGLAGGEACFLACSFWLVQCLALQGRREEAGALFAAAGDLANDLGLFSEEHDGKRMLGNFPQGLSHYSHISAAVALREGREPHHASAAAANASPTAG